MTTRRKNTPIEIKLLFADLLYSVLLARPAARSGRALAGIQIHNLPSIFRIYQCSPELMW